MTTQDTGALRTGGATGPRRIAVAGAGARAQNHLAAIARLPRKQRATLILRTYQELSHREIAEILGSSVGAVKANFFHALGNLKKILEGQSV